MSAASVSLQGKVAVDVNGTAGIGRAISLSFADAGADVIASAGQKDKVDAVAAELEAKSRSTIRVVCDIGSRASLEDLLRQALQWFGEVNILVNCVAKIRCAPTLTFPEDEWNDILDTNLTGTLRSCQIFGQHMLSANTGASLMSRPSTVSFVYPRSLHTLPARWQSGH
jgi:NAD(P)-dependent dehydrogenase (short-subunit alcohol dehydrogenase family)